MIKRERKKKEFINDIPNKTIPKWIKDNYLRVWLEFSLISQASNFYDHNKDVYHQSLTLILNTLKKIFITYKIKNKSTWLDDDLKKCIKKANKKLKNRDR